QACAQRWVAGEDPAWSRLHGAAPPPRIAAPTYPFAGERCWIVDAGEGAPASAVAEAGPLERLHPLISYNSSTLREVSFDSWLSTTPPAPFTQALHGHAALSPAAVLELACACAGLAGDRRIRGVRDVVWTQPLYLDSDLQLVRTSVRDTAGAIEYAVASLDDGGRRTVHSHGRLLLGSRQTAALPAPPAIAALKAQGVPLDAAAHYQRLEARGIVCGAGLRSVRELWCGPGTALARVALDPSADGGDAHFVLHPALIDGAFQVALALLDGPARSAYAPQALEELQIVRRAARSCYVHARMAAPGRGADDRHVFDICLLTEDGERLAAFKGLALRAVPRAEVANALAQVG
uniref:polyketide synthase dehydratase domain-containing protein n=1 Tax=Tahibacter caeni TaxID=1453545 RepID=UPI0021476F30